ncbi:duodenase-1-like isoform X2 [Ambystoma mexicanum]|uniref:duodenase-1-like isoform X2 n=1 Tax=Ambystoma mexicanum TaxID=8296 RepID=UPI0037E78554
MACLWSKEENKQVCGGFLVHKRFVMTAAHCISDLSDIRVVLGVQNWKKPEPCWQTFEKVTPYFSNYNKRSYENDIVLLKLHRSATLDKSVNLLPLPGNDWDIPEGTVCNVAGWGKTTLNGQQSSDLREVNVTILSNEHCASALELNHIAKTRLCAGLKGKAKDAYEYDSGGALVCDGVAEGIVSVGTKTSPPGIYTRIAKYIEWIQSTLKSAD